MSPAPDTAAWPGFAAWEPHIRSFVTVDPRPQAGSGALAGLRVGVKDIIDVAGLPTRNGSAACADAPPASVDAPVVARLRAAGAQIIGKTVTTEFAFTDPTPCRNPHDITRTPGGSSSGSGAAVAAGLVDLALGTQTAGSLCRPAAYCGVVGLKPGYGVLPVQGVTPLARSFDAVGVIARSVAIARAGFAAMAGAPSKPLGAAWMTIVWLLPGEIAVAPEMRRALDEAAGALARESRRTAPPQVPCQTAAIVAAHRTVMLAEAAAQHGAFLKTPKAALLQPKFKAALETGKALSPAEVDQARAVLATAKQAFWQAMAGVDAILTLPVPDAAPKRDGSTGFQDWLTPWTVFGGPLVSLPWGLDRLGRPRAVMLAGKPGADLPLLDLAARLEQAAPIIPAPVPPGTERNPKAAR